MMKSHNKVRESSGLDETSLLQTLNDWPLLQHHGLQRALQLNKAMRPQHLLPGEIPSHPYDPLF
jgi:hypothetical protein